MPETDLDGNVPQFNADQRKRVLADARRDLEHRSAFAFLLLRQGSEDLDERLRFNEVAGVRLSYAAARCERLTDWENTEATITDEMTVDDVLGKDEDHPAEQAAAAEWALKQPWLMDEHLTVVAICKTTKPASRWSKIQATQLAQYKKRVASLAEYAKEHAPK